MIFRLEQSHMPLYALAFFIIIILFYPQCFSNFKPFWLPEHHGILQQKFSNLCFLALFEKDLFRKCTRSFWCILFGKVASWHCLFTWIFLFYCHFDFSVSSFNNISWSWGSTACDHCYYHKVCNIIALKRYHQIVAYESDHKI